MEQSDPEQTINVIRELYRMACEYLYISLNNTIQTCSKMCLERAFELRALSQRLSFQGGTCTSLPQQ